MTKKKKSTVENCGAEYTAHTAHLGKMQEKRTEEGKKGSLPLPLKKYRGGW